MVFGKILKNAVCALLGAVFFFGIMSGAVKVSAASPTLGSLDLESFSDADRESALEDLGFDAPEEEYLAAYKDSAWKKNFTKAELRLMSAIIYAEANGMGFDAKVAVGNVVLNRMNDQDKYGYVSTIEEVIYDHKWGYQFSPVKDGSMAKALKLYDSMDPDKYKDWEIRAMTACKEAAKAALSGWKTVPDDFKYFNSHLTTQSKTCMEKGWSFKIIEKHIYYTKDTED
ncbi:MAG: cell wall hydrolase [Lachnospiraceae bacterium]|nr:cell wall hydrolase [Lachnospiraceae bacterium]MBR5732353.1 cell wall hydrolase [Lachnospiraceae bacterium]